MSADSALAARATTRGRPVVTSHGQIERAAFTLFGRHGFEATTMDQIATEAGVGRRTLFRYYHSKNDIPWGQFSQTLLHFRSLLHDSDPDAPVWHCVHQAVCRFNDFPEDADPPHEQRMRLILKTPTLQAHSALRYADWRAEIARFVASRLSVTPEDLLPRTVGRVSLALALSAYDVWLRRPTSSLPAIIESAMDDLRGFLKPQTSGSS